MGWPPPSSQRFGGFTAFALWPFGFPPDHTEPLEDERRMGSVAQPATTAQPRLPAVTFLLVGVLSVLEMLGCRLEVLADEPEDTRVSVQLPPGARLSVEGAFVLNAALTASPLAAPPRQAGNVPAAPPPSLSLGSRQRRRSRSPRFQTGRGGAQSSAVPIVIGAPARSRSLSSGRRGRG